METSPNAPMTGYSSETAAAEHARRSLDEARASADALAARGSEALHSRVAKTRESLVHTTDQAAEYVHAHPLKSIMMAAAAGAAIALLAGALGRHHGNHHEHHH